MLSGRGLCDELITRPEESYRLWCVVVCDLEASRMGAPYIYDISRLRVNVSGGCAYHSQEWFLKLQCHGQYSTLQFVARYEVLTVVFAYRCDTVLQHGCVRSVRNHSHGDTSSHPVHLSIVLWRNCPPGYGLPQMPPFVSVFCSSPSSYS